MHAYRYAAALTMATALTLTACGGHTDSWTMPNLVNKEHPVNLQDAQDQIEHLTGNAVRTTSLDASPADREQDVDSDWKVCNQSVKPGDKITEESSVEFTVVKNNEAC